MAYTNIDDPSAYFQTAIYTGNGGSDRAIVNDGNSAMQPDWVWYKSRSNASSHITYDSTRGDGPYLKPSDAGDEGTDANMFESFDSDGFSLNGDTDGNGSGRTYVAWQWKANGGTTTSVSASGTGSGCVNACTYQANTTAGFSIITYTGRDDQLSNAQESKLTHGLGVAPAFTIMKRTDSAGEWYVMGDFGPIYSSYFNNAYLLLNTTAAINGNSYVGDTAPDSTHIFLGNELVNIASATYVCYAFAEKQGYSKFGSYVGNGNLDGPFVYTGFKPAFLLVKITTASGYDWRLVDSARNTFNLTDKLLMPNNTSAEFDGSTHASNLGFDFVSNGFKLRTTYYGMNGNTETFIYMAFAENPFVTSTGIPATAR